MNVVSITESWSGITWSGDSSQRITTRSFLVETDTAGRGLLTFPLSSGGVTIPAQGTQHPDDGEFFSGVPAITAKGPTLFEVRIGYVAAGSSGSSGSLQANEYLDPLSQPADISWEDEDRMVEYDTDLDNKPVVSSLGQPFDPPLQRPISDPVLVIERNEAAFDPDTKLTYQDTVCEEVFWGAAAGRARMGKIRARKVLAKTPYWRVGYRVAFRMNTPAGVDDADAWKRQVLDRGTRYLGVIDGEDIVCDTPNGEIELLDADGYQTTADEPHWLYFREFKDASWTALGIDSGDV